MIEKIVEKLTNNLPESLSILKSELQKHLKEQLTMFFQESNLITKEEFIIQEHVLHKTRAKLEQLEKKVNDFTNSSI